MSPPPFPIGRTPSVFKKIATRMFLVLSKVAGLVRSYAEKIKDVVVRARRYMDREDSATVESTSVRLVAVVLATVASVGLFAFSDNATAVAIAIAFVTIFAANFAEEFKMA